jgi:hypothetical protein
MAPTLGFQGLGISGKESTNKNWLKKSRLAESMEMVLNNHFLLSITYKGGKNVT